MTAMLINPRLPLLCLVVGSFMGLWSGDKQPSIEMVIAQAKAESLEMVAAAESKRRAQNAYEDDVVLTSSSENVQADLDLPAYIAPGVYRAVNHRGDEQLVHVKSSDENRGAAGRDFYTHEADDQRWYLIRLDNTAVAAGARPTQR